MVELVQRLDPLPAFPTTRHRQHPHLLHQAAPRVRDHRRRRLWEPKRSMARLRRKRPERAADDSEPPDESTSGEDHETPE